MRVKIERAAPASVPIVQSFQIFSLRISSKIHPRLHSQAVHTHLAIEALLALKIDTATIATNRIRIATICIAEGQIEARQVKRLDYHSISELRVNSIAGRGGFRKANQIAVSVIDIELVPTGAEAGFV
jgi:hypothetical protein